MDGNKGKAKKKPDFKGFINYYLTRDEMSYVKGKSFSDADAVGYLLALSGDGYRITFSFDDFNECFQCTLLAQTTGKFNDGYAISGRGSDVIRAFKQVLYIHHEVCEGSWEVIAEKQQRWKEIDD